MKTVEILAGEHRLFHRVLASLDRVLDEAVQDGSMDVSLAVDIVDFLERFADGCHQDKEELVLFPKLMEVTPAESAGLVRDLVGLHGAERDLLGELRRHLEGAAYGDPLSHDQFVHRARAYVDLQRSHATREDCVLLPLAEAYLGRVDDVEVVAGFQRVERRHFGARPCDPASLVDAICARVDSSLGFGLLSR
jgi:hemerythrin-like domain-containing protein